MIKTNKSTFPVRCASIGKVQEATSWRDARAEPLLGSRGKPLAGPGRRPVEPFAQKTLLNAMDSFLKDRPKVDIGAPSAAGVTHALPPLGSGAMPTPKAPQMPSGPTNVELVKDAQGRIAHIVVTCSCGQCVQLDCKYPS